MFSFFINSLRSETGKDTSIVTIGTVVNVMAGSLFFVIVPRLLGPADYGLFSTAIATGLTAVAVANFGIDTGILRFAKSKTALNRILSVAFKSYIFIGLIVTLIGFSLSRPLASFMGYPQIANLLKIAFFGSIFLLLTNFFVAGLQARGDFAKASIVNIASNILRLFLIVFAAYFVTIGLFFVTMLFFSATILSVILGKMFLTFNLEKINNSDLISFHKYNLWIAFSLIIASIPFDNYFLLKFSGAKETGIYFAPLKILAISYQLGGNFTRVLAPKLSSNLNITNVKKLLTKASFLPLIFIICLLISILLSSLIVKLFFGDEYVNAGDVYRILSIGFIFFFAATIPSSVILYYLGRSYISFGITIIRYTVFVILLFILVPAKGAIGAATSFALTEFLSFILMTSYMMINLGKHGT